MSDDRVAPQAESRWRDVIWAWVVAALTVTLFAVLA